ncbi:Hpt domain-containing protein [Alkanindiges sp. WGS2144]|uniref:hybrid sensor histidine kinase/response regulator n=1 Tax=Alkanindiges sp. WGS2144 TaxID=3366808 RepID=UPI0037519630
MKKSAPKQDSMSVSRQDNTQQSAMALSWVIDSLDETLLDARKLVQAAKQPEQLKEASQLLHQVSGTLTMAELPDPLILSESLEQLALAMAARKIALNHSQELVNGIDTLKHELHRLHQAKRLQPLTIYRAVRQVRALLEAQKLSTSKTYPKIDYNLLMVPNQVQSPLNEESWRQATSAYRHLLNEFFLNPKEQATLEGLYKVAGYFAAGAGTVQQAGLWRVLCKLHQAMLEHKVDVSTAALKQNLVRLERMLAQERFDEGVLYELLELLEQFDLDHEFSLHQQAVSAALGENSITSPLVLDKILLLVQEARASLSEHTVDQFQIKRLLSEAIHLLELTGWRGTSQRLEQAIGYINQPEQKTAAIDSLEKIEIELKQLVLAFKSQAHADNGLDDQSFVEDAHSAVVRESRVALESIKSMFFAYSSSRQDKAQLADLPARFESLKGIFVFLGLERAAELTASLLKVLNLTLFKKDYILSRTQIDLIAQNIASLEYYLDQLAAHFHDDQILDKFAQSLEKITQSTEDEPIVLVGGQKIFHDKTPVELLSSIEGLAMAEQMPTNNQVASPGHQAILEISLPADDFTQDDDIREIFVEEATEVLESLQENVPQWIAQLQNLEILKEIRRSFHTLKGSGRMVGAFVSGEFAWSIENMLNRVLDNTISVQPVMIQLISEAIANYPQLVEDFSRKQTTHFEVRPYIYIANALSKGEDIAVEDLPWNQTQESEAAQFADDDQSSGIEQSVASPAHQEKTEEQHTAAIDNDSEQEDQEGLSIFVEEAEEHIETLHAFIEEQDEYDEVPDQVIRALHTLRGSAAMSNVDAICQLAAAVEDEFKRLIRLHQPVSKDHITFLEQLVQCVGFHLEALEQGKQLPLEEQDVVLIDQVAQFTAQAAGDGMQDSSKPAGVQRMGLVTHLLDLSLDELLDAEYELEDKLASGQVSEYFELLGKQSQQLYEASMETPVSVLQQLTQYLCNVYHKLSSVPAQAIDATFTEYLLNAHFALTGIFDALAAGQKPTLDIKVLEDLSDILAHEFDIPVEQPAAVGTTVAATRPQRTARTIDDQADEELLEIFMEEAEELIGEIEHSFSEWQHNPTDIEPLKILQRHLHTLKGGARMAQVSSLGDFGHELETVYERLVNGTLSSTPALVQFMRHAQDIVAEQVEQLSTEQTSFFAEDEFQVLQRYLATGDDSELSQPGSQQVGAEPTAALVDTAALVEPATEQFEPEQLEKSVATADLARMADEGDISKPATPTQPVIASAPTLASARYQYATSRAWTDENRPEPEILKLFLEEAQEQVGHSSQLLQQWLKDTREKRPLLELQRSLHTLKGGARMAGISVLGDFSHELEFVYEELATSQKPVPALAGKLLQFCHDWLSDAIEVLESQQEPLEPVALIQSLQLLRKDPDSLTSLPRFDVQQQQFQQEPSTQTLFEQESLFEIHGDGSEPPPMLGLFGQQHAEQVASANEMIRVSASMMEKMINLAGETAINRGRIEMGVNNIGFVLDEMGLTIQRLAEQLRRMEGELESQILARHEQERGQYLDFDPLEMDQYSALNQLSKSLAESASDLVDFKNTLKDKLRDTENLLLQQSRTQSELQDGLMNSRLVPFSRLLPRLQRIVRQTSTELGKPAELTIQNAEGELDRTILDRIVAPLEHMLRNAVDHGLETAEQRQAANKPAIGQISLNVERQGNEIIITLDDDGRGINVQAVRKKAIERGLIAADSKLSDYDVMQFIFNAGLTTAEKVTQISGRGVGMDVVQSEIKLLGGTVSADSTPGQGTRFTLRLPLTVAVTDALMVRVAERQFAIPLAHIERIVRVSPVALEQYYHSNNEQFDIDGQSYRLRYLGEFTQGIKAPHLQSQSMSLPVLLVKSMGKFTAIQVDQLVGSRSEIVVKPAGQQLTSIDMISGATILGDGSVSIILDAQALARRAAATERMQVIPAQETASVTSRADHRKQLVMVVDDSVTVRKVTTRLLERQGYEVVTAKDGVDAIEKLEEVTPDIMLLDIEMPRMDGFEVANLVRHNDRISELPIIMITSRTGEKHRERAFLTGVNCYMGKPFQELELLQNIEELLETASNG